MIYKKDANFPYPVLTNTSNTYKKPEFLLDIELKENSQCYKFEIKYNISSLFINNLLEDEKAQLILVIQSKDNKFFNLELGQKYIEIKKSRISLSKRTVIQLLIKAKEDIEFKENNDLNSFYNNFKEQIVLPKNSIVGFSNTVIFDGSNAKPLDLFEKKINPNLKSDIKIELGSETIIIHYKNKDLQFADSHISNKLNNHYVYMGLQKALYRFIINNNVGGDYESVDLSSIEAPTDGLDFKLYNIMKNKFVDELNIENIDEVICLISDKILEKHSAAIKGLYSNGN